MGEFSETLSKKLAGIVELSVAQAAALERHCEMMLRWNRRLNLTRITELAEVVERHYCESVFLAAHLPFGSYRVADLGSCAGFPGVAVAVVHRDREVSLVESHRRRAVFLRESTRDLGNVRVLAARAEDLTERFAWAVSRAVAYDDLRAVLGRVSDRAALLTGAVEGSEMPGYEWERRIALPWGKRRFLWLGRNVQMV